MSASYNSTGLISCRPDGDIPLYARTTLLPAPAGSRNKVVKVADAADATFGTAKRPGFADDPERGQELISVKMLNAPGTHFAICEDAIADGAEFEGADAGAIKALAGGTALGRVIEVGGGAAGSVTEVFYY